MDYIYGRFIINIGKYRKTKEAVEHKTTSFVFALIRYKKSVNVHIDKFIQIIHSAQYYILIIPCNYTYVKL